ncbi:MAG: TonB-dependent receptor domain-containing protein [Blastocatellia bacterium]
MLHCRQIIFGLLICSGMAGSVGCQFTEATLRGRVVELAGNAVTGATVVAVNESTGLRREAKSDQDGAFLLAGLPPAIYQIEVEATGFRTWRKVSLRLAAGQTTELVASLEIGEVTDTITISGGEVLVRVATEGRMADNFGSREISALPLPQRDVFSLPGLSAGATAIAGAANSTKLTNSPVVTVNGNRYRGNNYVLDGAINTNPNNTGEPTLVPALESVEEAQVQTSNFSSEYGRGNGAVINLRTKSGGNLVHGRVWSYHRNAALNARNFFATARPPQIFNQFGANIGGPIRRNRTFYFGSYEGTRNATGRVLGFLVETPELRSHVARTSPSGIAARLMREYPAPLPAKTGCATAAEQRNCLETPGGYIPAVGLASVTVRDLIRLDQLLARLDHSFNGEVDRISVRWISERQRDNGGTSSSQAILGRAARGFRGPFDGYFANLNTGYSRILARGINDLRFSIQDVDTTRGTAGAKIPEITVTGLTMPFGDVFRTGTRLRTSEVRDTVTLDRGRQTIRFGGEFRRGFKGLSIGPPTAGSFAFRNIAEFIADRPFRQTLTVNPVSGEPTGFPRYFTQYETGLFIQDDWKVSSALMINLGLRHDYFSDVAEREGRLSSLIFGDGATFRERLANAKVGRVDRLYRPQRANFAPRLGLAWDPFGKGRDSLRAGFSLAFQPHHGQSIAGARALPPDALQGVLQPTNRIGTRILYDLPVPFNPEFARGLNAQGGVITKPGESPIRPTGFVVNPTIKTQYSESWFLNLQHQFSGGWIAELGYSGTVGINLERIDDINRFAGDLLDGREDRINPNFGPLLFVSNGVTSGYHALTTEVRRNLSRRFSLQLNYRWSKWLDTSSDTSTGQFQDNSEPGKGAQDVECLRCERSRSLFDIPHRLAGVLIWTPAGVGPVGRMLHRASRNWQLAGIITAQSGRPFSVWNGAPSNLVNGRNSGGDYNLDGGGGAVGGGFYDRPHAPTSGAVGSSFGRRDFLSGLFPASAFPAPAPGENGALGRNTFRGPNFTSLELSLSRGFALYDRTQLEIRFEAFNALNNVNLFLPNSDLSLASFGRSTQAHDARTLQCSLRLSF